MPEKETYNLSILKDNPEHTFELTTITNSVVPLSIKAIIALAPPGERPPTITEATKLMAISLGNGADPYAGECGLMPNYTGGFHYVPWVSAQTRLRKAQSQPDYNGYEWGWITSDFTRHKGGRETKADPSKIVGVWGCVHRKSIENPYYHETFIADFKKTSKSGKGTWDKMPTVMIMKVNRDQTHKFAYADVMGNLNTLEELKAYNQFTPLKLPDCDVPDRYNRRVKIAQDVIVTATPATKSKEDSTRESVVTDDKDTEEANIMEDVTAEEPVVNEAEAEAEAEPERNTNRLDNLKKRFVEEGGNDFPAFVAYVLCIDDDEVDRLEFGEMECGQIERQLDGDGIPEGM